MMKRILPRSSALAAISISFLMAGCGGSDSALMNTDSNPPTTGTVAISAALDGAQSVPAVPTRASGTVTMELNNADGSLSGNIMHSVADATVAHIHTGVIGQTGVPIVALEETSNSQFDVPAGTVLSAEQMTMFRAGNYYVNVHSTEFPDGEIRGQLSNETVVVPLLANLNDIQAKVFTPICSVCHTGGGSSLPASMDLSNADASYAALVGTNSVSVPELLRIAESDADNSFLINKIEGSQTVGARMPLGREPLSDQAIAAIRSWVDAGAQR